MAGSPGLVMLSFLRIPHGFLHRLPSLLIVFVLFSLAPSLRAQQTVVTLDPAATQVTFTLGATMHTVEGSFKLKNGEVRFDPSTGNASGSVVVDATSGNTDNTSRDQNMHRRVLESAKFPEIIFTPDHMTGSIAPQGTSTVQLSGRFQLLGQEHPMTLAVSVEPGLNGGPWHVSTKFTVPYVEWGLKNPSTFVLRVRNTVDLEINAEAYVMPGASPPAQ